MGSTGEVQPRALISGIAHVNLIVTAGGLSAAQEFYGGTLGLTSVPVPKTSVGKLAWWVLLGVFLRQHIFAMDTLRP
jgi:hypothetical protein